MSDQNGRMNRADLMEVQHGVLLAKPQGRAFRRAAAAFFDNGDHLRLVDSSAGYRSYAVQSAMRAASIGSDASAKAKWNLDPHSSVPLAAAGYSSHGLGDRADLLVNGKTPTAAHRTLLATFGWTREFGGADPNHFKHDRKTATTPVSRAFCLNHSLFVQDA